MSRESYEEEFHYEDWLFYPEPPEFSIPDNSIVILLPPLEEII